MLRANCCIKKMEFHLNAMFTFTLCLRKSYRYELPTPFHSSTSLQQFSYNSPTLHGILTVHPGPSICP